MAEGEKWMKRDDEKNYGSRERKRSKKREG